MFLSEMSSYRVDAMEQCMNLSKRFIEHFIKAYNEGVTSTTFHHHCSEMQAWWDTVKSITLTPKNKLISKTDLMDWFFTGGSTPDRFLNDDTMIDVYNDLIFAILDNRETASIEEILYNIMLRYGI